MLARPGGHPLHPVLVHFPVACWTIGVGADLFGSVSGHAGWWSFGFVCLSIGLVTGIAAILAGFLEFALLPKQHPALDTATLHMTWALVAWSLFAFTLLLRNESPAEQPSPWAMAASLGGLAAMLGVGWLGGRLVYRFGVGVETPAQR
jgi:uncharacterized membrane protein